MSRWAALAVLLTLVCGCSATPLRIDSGTLAGKSNPTSGNFIVAGVDNQSLGSPGHAGSSPRGYDAIRSYGPTPHARQILRALEGEYGLREVNAWPIKPLHMHCAVLEVPSGTDTGALLVALSADPRLVLAQPLQTFVTRSEAYNDPYVGLQSGFKQMDVAEAHPWSRGEGVRVAIIDTGVDTEHPDLRGTVVGAANFVDTDDRQFRADRHGTEVAGVIAAVANNREGIVGVAPAAHVLAFKACWQLQADADAAQCNTFTLARALVAAFNAHAQVINLSIAGPADPLLGSLVASGLKRGIVFVEASPGDAAVKNLMQQPGIIEVASDDEREGDPKILAAPGREILTLLPGGRYDFASGVSIATAQVSGVMALLLAKKSAMLPAEAYVLLQRTGAGGHINACAAVAAVIGRGQCTPQPDETRLVEERPGRFVLH